MSLTTTSLNHPTAAMSTTSLDDHSNAVTKMFTWTSPNYPTNVVITATETMSITSLGDHTNAAMSTTLPNDTVSVTMDLMSTVASKTTKTGIIPVYYIIGTFTVLIVLFVMLAIIILLKFIHKRYKEIGQKTGESLACQKLMYNCLTAIFLYYLEQSRSGPPIHENIDPV